MQTWEIRYILPEDGPNAESLINYVKADNLPDACRIAAKFARRANFTLTGINIYNKDIPTGSILILDNGRTTSLIHVK